MANPWFRMYAEFATDPKVQMLSEVDQRRYVMLLCLRCSNGDVTLQDEEVAFQLRVTPEEWAASKARFMAKGLIDEANQPTAWDRRQYASDSSAARVAVHRQRKKQACNVTETPPDTDTDTEKATTPLPPEGAAAAKPPAPAKPKFDAILACPPNVTPEVWRRWVQCRREQGKPLKETTCTAQAKQLANHPNADAVVERSIAAGWTGLFPEKVTHASSAQPGRQGPLSAVDRVKQAIADREAQSDHAGQALVEDDRALREPLDGEFRRVG